MNIIEYWASLISESTEENVSENSHSMARPESNWGRGRFGMARPDELGKRIMGLFSPANFQEMQKGEESPFYQSGFNCFITDKAGIRMKYPDVDNMDKLGDGLIAFFTCEQGALTPELIVNSFNSWCGDVLPKKYTEDDLINLGSHDMSGTRHNNEHFKDAYAINLTQKLDGGKVDTDSVMSTFDSLKDEYKDTDVTLQIGKKEDFEKYFRRNRGEFDKLDNSSQYMVFFCFQGSMDEKDVLKLANDVNKSGEEGDFGLAKTGSFTENDITKVGFIRRKYSKSQNFENFDVFAVKTTAKEVK